MRESERKWMGNGDLGPRIFAQAWGFKGARSESLSPSLARAAGTAGRGEHRSRGVCDGELRDTGSLRRIGVKIIVHALTDRGGELGLMRRSAQPQLLRRIRNIGRFHQ